MVKELSEDQLTAVNDALRKRKEDIVGRHLNAKCIARNPAEKHSIYRSNVPSPSGMHQEFKVHQELADHIYNNFKR